MLKSMKVAELRALAAELGIEGTDKIRKPLLRETILQKSESNILDDTNYQEIAEHEIIKEPAQEVREKQFHQNADEEHTKSHRHYSDEERPQVEGILDVVENGFGFLRFENYLSSEKDIYVSSTQIKRFNLKTGDKIKCITRHPNDGERFGALLYVTGWAECFSPCRRTSPRLTWGPRRRHMRWSRRPSPCRCTPP